MNELTKLIELEKIQRNHKTQEQLVNTPTRKGVSIRKVFTDLEQRFYELLTETKKRIY